MKTRLLALVNVALVPWVWLKHPDEFHGYTRKSLRAVWTGKGDLDR